MHRRDSGTEEQQSTGECSIKDLDSEESVAGVNVLLGSGRHNVLYGMMLLLGGR